MSELGVGTRLRGPEDLAHSQDTVGVGGETSRHPVSGGKSEEESRDEVGVTAGGGKGACDCGADCERGWRLGSGAGGGEGGIEAWGCRWWEHWTVVQPAAQALSVHSASRPPPAVEWSYIPPLLLSRVRRPHMILQRCFRLEPCITHLTQHFLPLQMCLQMVLQTELRAELRSA